MTAVLGWQYLVVAYRAKETALAALLPAELQPIPGAAIGFEWRRTLMRPAGGERIDAAVVVPCRLGDREFGYELRHYCDQLRPARLRAGIACDGGPDFYAKLVAAPQLRMGTLHDGDDLVAAAILSQRASTSAAGTKEAAAWMALPRVKPAELGKDGPAEPAPDRRQVTFQRKGAVTFELMTAPSGGAVAPAAEEVLHAQFFVAAPNDHEVAITKP